MVAMLVHDILDDLGVEVIGPALSLVQAALLLGKGGIAGALLDVDVAGVTSYPLAAALRAEGVPFAFVTGYCVEDLDPEFRDAVVLRKPLDIRDVQQIVIDQMGPPVARRAAAR